MFLPPWLTSLRDWFLPGACIFCGAQGRGSLDLCSSCETDLPWLNVACRCCALPLSDAFPTGTLCGHCSQTTHPFTKTIALFSYQFPIDKLIMRIKFQKKLMYAQLLSHLFSKKIQDLIDKHDLPDAIIPVPLHYKRLRERGFNQALEIIRPVAKKLKIPLDLQGCSRIQHTVAQMTLPASQRQANVKDAFRIKQPLKIKYGVIFDDVVTTGHTVTEIAKALKNAGVDRVDVWCCARTAI